MHDESVTNQQGHRVVLSSKTPFTKYWSPKGIFTLAETRVRMRVLDDRSVGSQTMAAKDMLPSFLNCCAASRWYMKLALGALWMLTSSMKTEKGLPY